MRVQEREEGYNLLNAENLDSAYQHKLGRVAGGVAKATLGGVVGEMSAHIDNNMMARHVLLSLVWAFLVAQDYITSASNQKKISRETGELETEIAIFKELQKDHPESANESELLVRLNTSLHKAGYPALEELSRQINEAFSKNSYDYSLIAFATVGMVLTVLGGASLLYDRSTYAALVTATGMIITSLAGGVSNARSSEKKDLLRETKREVEVVNREASAKVSVDLESVREKILGRQNTGAEIEL